MTWLVWRAIGKHPRIFILALARVLSVYPQGFAKMGHRWMGRIGKESCDKICVWGGQGRPQAPATACGPAKTPGSKMKSRAVAGAASRYFPFGAACWIVPFAVLAVIGLPSLRLHAESANSYFKQGESAEAREDYDAAFDNFQKAYAKDPKDLRIRTALYRVRVTDSAMHLSKGRKLIAAG